MQPGQWGQFSSCHCRSWNNILNQQPEAMRNHCLMWLCAWCLLPSLGHHSASFPEGVCHPTSNSPLWCLLEGLRELHCLLLVPSLAVQVLAGTELNFLHIANMWLCLAFVLKMVLITQECFCYCSAVLTHHPGLCLSRHPTHEEAGGAEEVRRGHSWDT